MSASPARPWVPSRPPDLRACRTAACAVRASPYWRQVRNVVRPPGTGIHRSRPPLGLLLYAAARDGRLVWGSADEFAVLEPPTARAPDWASSDAGRTWLGRLSRWWDLLLFLVPPFVALLLSVPIAFVPKVGVLLALLVILLAVLYVTVQMIVGIVWTLWRFSDPAEGNARGFHWTVTLCHVSDPTHLDRMLRAALDRSRRLAAASIRPDPADGTHVVACLERGITTKEARAAVRSAPSAVSADPTPSGVSVVSDSSRFEPPRPEAQRPIRIVPLLLVTTALVIAVEALFVADYERAACTAAGDCANRPAAWPDAVLWLLSRMYLRDDGFVAATWRARVLGHLMPPLGAVVLLCLVVASWRHARYVRERRIERFHHLDISTNRTVRILVLVVLDVERDAVIEAVAEAGGPAVKPSAAGKHPIFRLGRLDRAEIFLAQAAQGTATPASMMLTANGLIEELQPHYVVLAGICFGLWSRELDGGDQELFDVVVSEYVQGIDHRRVTDRDGDDRVLWRGERVQATGVLLKAFHAATFRWTGPRVHFGPVLSSNTLSDSAAFRAELRREFPEASAGEMELTGLYAAATDHGCGWIMAKGVSDWGAGGLTDDARRLASRHAAAFIVRAITQETLPGGVENLRSGRS